MMDPFQALSWFAGVHVPEADTSNLRARAQSLRAFADSIEEIAGRAEAGVGTVRRHNDSRTVDRFADLWPNELAPRYAAMAANLRELADGCDEYAETVDEHREQLWIIGTQIAAMAFTMMFGYLYPSARFMAEAAMKWLVARARLEKTIFQKIIKMVLAKRIGKYNVGTYLVREGLDAVSDALVWTVVKTGVHVASSAATGQPIGSIPDYMAKHFAAELAYNGGIKAMRDVRRFIPATKVTETLLGTGPAGNFFRRTVSASLVYNGVTGSISDEATLRSALAHAPRAFILKR
ncbi:hypothetical protein FHR32_005422 [Streptosporangium album]|uniref:Outer membrane channel protein CpnT-like N-terminal domain-containing protein n=1 Tax=Streptosporangium album TaxID=47479 RepID=A0A7W7RZJ8_9ACTN|nr:hypothetical protein [Streptosporangium album]MBB4941045.1 hypothetical protein [Streptosporangium album]